MASLDKIRVLIVDDSFFIRTLIRDILEKESDMEVVGEAGNGYDSILQVGRLKPDVITMDYNMPEMDGATATFKILHMNDKPPAIIMLSASTLRGAEITLRCLRAGAVDCIAKPAGENSLNIDEIKEEIVAKIRTAAGAKIRKLDELENNDAIKTQKNKFPTQAVVIGASTGGPPVVENILSKLPSNLNIAIFIIQHMPQQFTSSFANRLDRISSIHVKEAKEGDVILSNCCYLAPGDWHMEIRPTIGLHQTGLSIHLHKAPKVNGFRPSIDVTMNSVASIYKEQSLGIVLTGMGYDGSGGIKTIKQYGGKTIVQSPETAAIDSMPEAAIRTNCVDEIMDENDMVKKITEVSDII